MIALTLFIKNIFGWITLHWRIVAGAIAVLLIVIVFGLVYRSCNKPPKLNEAEIQKGEQAVKERNDKVLRDILTNSDVKEKEIDANLAYAENKTVEAIHEASTRYANMNASELQAEFDKRR